MTDMTAVTNMTTLSLDDIQAELDNLEGQIAELQDQIRPLELRRDKILTFKEMFEEFISGRTGDDPGEDDEDQEDQEHYGYMTIAEGAVRVLEKERAWLDTHSMIAHLEKIGIKSQAENVYTSVFGTLNREVKRSDTKLAKKDGRWGLLEWLPSEEEDSTSTPPEPPRLGVVDLSNYGISDQEEEAHEEGEEP